VTYAAKELHFNRSGEALKRMQAGVDKLASVVGVTLGPKVRRLPGVHFLPPPPGGGGRRKWSLIPREVRTPLPHLLGPQLPHRGGLGYDGARSQRKPTQNSCSDVDCGYPGGGGGEEATYCSFLCSFIG